MSSRLRRALERNWFFAGLAAIIALGIHYPAIGIALKPWINVLVFSSLFLIGFRLDFAEVRAAAANVRAVFMCLFCSFAAMPLLSITLAKVFFSGDLDMFVGVVLAGAIPTTQASSVIWTDLSRGNRGLALVLMSAANIFGVFASPVILSLLLGATISFPVGQMVVTLLIFVLVPAVLGQLVRLWYGDIPAKLEASSRTLNILIIWASVLTALSSGDVLSLPLVLVIISVALQYSAIAALSYFGSRLIGLSRRDAIAVMFCSAQVTITVANVIGFTYFAARSIIYIVVYHLFQQMMGQVTARLLERRQNMAAEAPCL